MYSATVESGTGQAADAVGSEFQFSMPLAGSEVTFAGQYSEATDRPQGFAAAYEFQGDGAKRSAVGLNVRQGALVGGVEGHGRSPVRAPGGTRALGAPPAPPPP